MIMKHYLVSINFSKMIVFGKNIIKLYIIYSLKIHFQHVWDTLILNYGYASIYFLFNYVRVIG